MLRLTRNREFGKGSLRTTWPQRDGQAQGELRGVEYPVSAVKDGRRDWGPNDLTLTVREGKAHYSHRHQIAEPFRSLKHEFGWGSCPCQTQQAPWAHVHLGVSALVFTHQIAFARGQTTYASRRSLCLQSIPQNPLALQEFAQAA